MDSSVDSVTYPVISGPYFSAAEQMAEPGDSDLSDNQLDMGFWVDDSDEKSDFFGWSGADLVEIIPLPNPADDGPLAISPEPQDFSLPLIDPEAVIPLPEPLEFEQLDVSLAPLAWGANVPIITERDPRLVPSIVNLSGLPLTTGQMELLAYGLNFQVSPKHVPRLKVMAGIEATVGDLRRSDPEQVDHFRIEAARILDHSKQPQSNLADNILQAAKDLCKNSNLVVTSADKGGRTVILKADHYAEACGSHLEDEAYERVQSFGTGCYKVHLTDPRTQLDTELLNQDFGKPDVTDRLLKLQCGRLANLLKKLHASHDLLPSVVHRLGPPHPYSGVVPKFHALPKLHKVGWLKIRPIISNYGIHCNSILQHLKSIINLLPHG